MTDKNNILLLALGNDIMGDDGITLSAARILATEFPEIEVEEAFGNGFELLDFLEGKKKVLLIDTITTGLYPLGTIIRFTKNDFQKTEASSPHYVGLPEVIKLAERLNLDFPDDIKILAVEINPQYEVKEEISPEIKAAEKELVRQAEKVLRKWMPEKQIICDIPERLIVT